MKEYYTVVGEVDRREFAVVFEDRDTWVNYVRVLLPTAKVWYSGVVTDWYVKGDQK